MYKRDLLAVGLGAVLFSSPGMALAGMAHLGAGTDIYPSTSYGGTYSISNDVSTASLQTLPRPITTVSYHGASDGASYAIFDYSATFYGTPNTVLALHFSGNFDNSVDIVDPSCLLCEIQSQNTLIIQGGTMRFVLSSILDEGSVPIDNSGHRQFEWGYDQALTISGNVDSVATSNLGVSIANTQNTVQVSTSGSDFSTYGTVDGDFLGTVFEPLGDSGILTLDVLMQSRIQFVAGGGDYTGFVSLDPYFSVDHDYLALNPNSYVTVSDGAGNEPLGSTSGAPEPSTWALLISGLGIAGATLRRQRSLIRIA